MSMPKFTKSELNAIHCFLVDFYIDIKANKNNDYYKNLLVPLDKLIVRMDKMESANRYSLLEPDMLFIQEALTKFYNECTLKNSIHDYTDDQMKEFNKIVKSFKN